MFSKRFKCSCSNDRHPIRGISPFARDDHDALVVRAITGRYKAGDRSGGGGLGESMKIKNVSDPKSTSFKLPQFSFLDTTSVKKITIKIHLSRPSYWVNFRWYSVSSRFIWYATRVLTPEWGDPIHRFSE